MRDMKQKHADNEVARESCVFELEFDHEVEWIVDFYDASVLDLCAGARQIISAKSYREAYEWAERQCEKFARRKAIVVQYRY